MSRSFTYATGGFLLGAGLNYFFDPVRGRRRRRRIGDLGAKLRRKERNLLDKASRDAAHRVHGVVERTVHPLSPAAPDQVIEGRVRAQLGHVLSHSHAIEVTVRDGTVALRGPILEREATEALHQVRQIAGVRDVIDQLERHPTADRIPSLQGEPVSRRGEQWTPAARGGAILGGAALTAWGLIAKRGLGTIAGSALALRGAVNQPFRRIARLLAGREGIEVRKSITVRAPIDQVFDLWSRFETFPKFMQHVQSVRIHGKDRKRSTWTIEGPGGLPITFDAELTQYAPSRVIAWKTLPGERIEHEGVVLFELGADGTRVEVRMTYRPPGGMFAHAIAHLLSSDPKARIDDDLVRMKGLLEEGRTRAHGERVALADVR
jgi:uncharacterized membrane protein